MWLTNPKASGTRKGGGGGNGLVAVAIDKDKGSQYALKWAVDSLLTRGQTLILIHVLHGTSSPLSRGNEAIICNISSSPTSPQRYQLDNDTKDLFLTFHCYCTRKDIQCLDVLLEDTDVVKAITEYVSYAAIENLVIGATSRHALIRFKSSSTSSSISKGAPDFCTVFVISKSKMSTRNATRPAAHTSPLLNHIHILNNQDGNQPEIPSRPMNFRDRTSTKPHSSQGESITSPFGRGIRTSGVSCVDSAESDTALFVSSERPSSGRSSSVYDDIDAGRTSRVSTSSDHSFRSTRSGLKFNDAFSHESCRTSFSYSSQSMDEAEADVRRKKLEIKQTMEMYGTAYREAIIAKQKLMELNHCKIEENKKLEEARLAEEAVLAIAEKEKARCREAGETAEASKKIAEVESHKRASVEVKAVKEAEEMRKLLDNQTDVRYRSYNIEEIEAATNCFAESQRIGEGGYGPVYKCYLDHTPVAVKVLRPDAAQGKSQFQQEVINHCT